MSNKTMNTVIKGVVRDNRVVRFHFNSNSTQPADYKFHFNQPFHSKIFVTNFKRWLA